MKYFITGIISALISIIISVGYLVYFYDSLPGIELLNEGNLGTSITTINATDTIKDSRAVINTNFSNLNSGKMESGTTSVDSITTLTNLATANSLTLNSTQIGVASSTPFAQLAVGAGSLATSTIATGKFCMYAGQENGVNVYVYLKANAVANQPFATTTVSCF